VTATDIFEAGGFAPSAPNTYASLPAIKPEDVSNAVLYLLSTPYHVNVTELTVKHVSQRF
jgi:NADP-dependent 3-hydroxy acid dehydrogenase YdfG